MKLLLGSLKQHEKPNGASSWYVHPALEVADCRGGRGWSSRDVEAEIGEASGSSFCVWTLWRLEKSYINSDDASSHGPVHRSIISASGAYNGDMSRGISRGTTEDWPPRIESNWIAWKRGFISWMPFKPQAKDFHTISCPSTGSGDEGNKAWWSWEKELKILRGHTISMLH